jgi:hypothetical protein
MSLYYARAGFKTVGDFPNFAPGAIQRMVAQQNGTVPLFQTHFETSSSVHAALTCVNVSQRIGVRHLRLMGP